MVDEALPDGLSPTAAKTLSDDREPLSPREARLQQTGRIFRWGALLSFAVSVGGILVALLGAIGLIPGVFTPLHNVLLFRYTGSDGAALAAVILLGQINMSLLLVLMVGVLARELWAIPAIWILVLANIGALVLLGYTPGIIVVIAGIWGGVITGSDLRAFRLNPVMLKELRGRMRGMRAFVVITVYLGLMSGFTTLLYLVWAAPSSLSGSAAAGEIGRVLFMGIFGIELLLIIFIAPSFTAGAITGERERQTYDLLRTTLLANPSFVIGKLESALSYILLLLLSAIPLQSIAFLFGGVTEAELILSFVILAVTAIALGTVGIYFSAATERTLSASVRAYTLTLVATFGAPLVVGVLVGVFRNALNNQAFGFSSTPFLDSVLTYFELVLVSINPVATALTTQQLLTEQQVIGFWAQTLPSDGSTIPVVSPWISFTIIYLTASAVMIVLAVRSISKVEE